jgi:hypothetical protein
MAGYKHSQPPVAPGPLPPFLKKGPDGITLDLGKWAQATPVYARIIGPHKKEVARLTSDYKEWNPETNTATATLKSKGGTELHFEDVILGDANKLSIKRTVSVKAVGKDEAGFATRFAVQRSEHSLMVDNSFFMPGVWYKDNKDAPDMAIGTTRDATHMLVREDRTPFPLIMCHDPKSNIWGTLMHTHCDGSTCLEDTGRACVINEKIKYGSIGVINKGQVQLAFQYPSSEGSTTYVSGKSNSAWATRAHPLKKDFIQHYELDFVQGEQNSFAEALQKSWREAYLHADPKPPKADRSKVYNASVELFGIYIKEYDGVPSVPFQVGLPDGEVKDRSSQIGFVGKATLSASFLMAACMGKTTHELSKEALEQKDVWLKNAIAIIDFWVKHSMNPSGVPKVWYNINLQKPDKIGWRPYETHLRVASDGLLGILHAWKLMPKPEWLDYCKKFGDFLVDKQYEDGSLDGNWNADGSVKKSMKNISHHCVAFLADLFTVTKEEKYKTCALKIGEYAMQAVHEAYRYAGGAADNPNALDKEAGVMALAAFLALYEIDKEQKWLDAAVQAGTYVQTWTYIWDVPLIDNLPERSFPLGRTVLGGSIIAAGQSGADNFMAGTIHHYKRLHKHTGDEHFLNFSHFLEDATSQLLDWDGKLGYKHPGLHMEAYSAVSRGRGVKGWLPWLTCQILEPFMDVDV